MTTKIFHIVMLDNVLHLIALWYLVTHVDGQPEWFYITGNTMLAGYLITTCITLLAFYVSNLAHSNQPKPPRNP